MILLWSSFSSHGQCPTIPVSNPSPICDASGFTFANLSAYANDNGGGIVWYPTSTGGSAFNASQLVKQGVTYYAGDSSGSCGSRMSIVVDFQVDPSGKNLDRIYCSNDNATIQTYIDDVLQSGIPSGGTVRIFYDFGLTNQANTTDAIPNGASNYYVVFVDNGGCESQLEIGQVGVFNAPADPTPPSSQQFCATSNPVIGNLNRGTTATNYKWYANVDVFGDPIQPALSVLTPLIDGRTYYIQIDDIFCVSNAIPVTVNINTPANAGTQATIEYCNDSLPTSDFNLFDELGGLKDTTGTWAGPLATSNGYLGTVNISTLTTAGNYVFTYTVPSTGVCPNGVATVTIRVYQTFSSGTALSAASFCESTAPTAFDLFSLLANEDPNGQWTQGTLSSDPVVTSPIDLTSLIPGTYNFTYTQNLTPNPCTDQSTTVQIIILQDPNAGNAVNQTFCENDLVSNSPFNLFDALDGSQDNNSGIWTDASNITISNVLDLNTLTVAGSPYSFNYTIDNGTCSDTETITITIEDAPESGTANAPAAFCEGLAPTSYNLFDLLTGEDATGTWFSGTDNLGASVSNPIDLSGLTPGDYNFTYDVDAIGSCDDVLVTVMITINPLPITGTPTAAIYCENDLAANSPLNLFGQLTGEDAGGTWTDDNTTGTLTGSDVNLNALAIGSYNFTYTITDVNGCSNSSTVVVTVQDAPESGTANTAVEFCLSAITPTQTVNLFDLLTGEDQTGVWNDDNASGALSGSVVTIAGLSAGTYNFTYDVDAIGSCDDVLVTVSIVINDTPSPTANASQEFCDTATVSNLLATGTAINWYDDATGGSPLAGTLALISGETYYATQTDATTGCESSVRTLVTATIYQSPKSGIPNPITVCNTNTAVNLFTALDGSQDAGGVWQDTDSTGALTGNTFNASAVTPGTYQFTYLVTASSPCIDANTIITIIVEPPLSAGTDNTLDVCSNNGTTDLFTLIGSADIGGTWSPAMASGTGVFNPLVDTSGTYRYTVTNACGTDTSEVVVIVTQAPNAGTNNTTTICRVNGQIDLFTLLGNSAQSGGTWSPLLTSGTSIFDPNVDASGVYRYTVTALAPCSPDDFADITVTVNDSPQIIVLDNNPAFCKVDNPTVANLAISIRPTGTVKWYADAALTIPVNLTDALINGEDYFATQTTGSGCESSQSVQITATINDAPTPTLVDASQEYCVNDNPTISILTDNITEKNATASNIVWYDAATNGNIISSSTALTNLTTYYAALVDATTGCESSVRLAVTPDLTSCGILVIPDGFSPNGDGVNDTFDVDNLDILYPNFEMEIYNRYGSIVYKGNASTPRFDGKSNQPRSIGSGDLPVGVYFYIFNFNDGSTKPKQGRLYLSR
ncbi:gliding motility-associated C-terminal domain-containing protein [Mariniflexile jejuense]|uniref:Gliding motility-associated C-terminal domain-containing protein n=1 Tax=Mariniflexile jejuense TaxID=1173582 RepID=A0ABW3JH08_9FLAO